MIYKTQNGRFVIAQKELASAISPDGFLNLAMLTEEEETHDAPNLLLAQMIAEAEAQLKKPGAKVFDFKELSLLAETAATSAAWCCKNPCEQLDHLHFTHLAETDKGRWALSTEPIPALDPRRPGLVYEGTLTPEQMENTCLIASKTVAVFLTTAMSHRFEDQTGPHAYFGAKGDQVFCRSENDLPLGAMSSLPEREMVLHIHAAELQILLAKMYCNLSKTLNQNSV